MGFKRCQAICSADACFRFTSRSTTQHYPSHFGWLAQTAARFPLFSCFMTCLTPNTPFCLLCVRRGYMDEAKHTVPIHDTSMNTVTTSPLTIASVIASALTIAWPMYCCCVIRLFWCIYSLFVFSRFTSESPMHTLSPQLHIHGVLMHVHPHTHAYIYIYKHTIY